MRTPSEGSNSFDVPELLSSPLTIYDEKLLYTLKVMNVITVGQSVIFSGKVIKADSVILEGTADGEILGKTVESSWAGSLDGTV